MPGPTLRAKSGQDNLKTALNFGNMPNRNGQAFLLNIFRNLPIAFPRGVKTSLLQKDMESNINSFFVLFLKLTRLGTKI